MNPTSSYNGLKIIFFSTIFLHLGKISIFYLYGIDKIVSEQNFILTNIDFIITIFICSTFFFLNKSNIVSLKLFYQSFEINKKKDSFFRFVGIFGILTLFFYAKESLSLILSGVGRQEAVDILGRSSIFKVLFGKFFVYSVVFICILNVRKSTKIIYSVGFLLSVISFSSRSDIAIVFFLFFIINMVNFNAKIFIKVLKYSVLVTLLSLFVTAFIQNRELESHFLGPLKPIEDFFLYGSYSMVLAERAVYTADLGSKYIFPFIGYLTEFFVVKFDTSQVVVDSNFISQFVLFYSDVRQHAANVSYPWWAWFFGAYSFLGVIFLKPLFLMLLYYLTLRLKLYTFFIYFTYWFVFSSFNKFPLISIEGYITLLSLLFIEVTIRLKHNRC